MRSLIRYSSVAGALLAFCAAPALAQQQPVSGGSSGSHTGQDVSVGTSGYGSTDGTSINVGGTAEGSAANGGTTKTGTRANVNDRRGMQRSTATARDDDERARSMTRTRVRQGEVVDSRTMTMYKERGERPVREVTRTKATPEGTTTNTNGSSRPK